MRIFGIIAVFTLTLVAIGEGAALVRLSRKVDSLNQQLGGTPNVGGGDREAVWAGASDDSTAGRAGPRVRDGGTPRLSPLVFQAPPPAATNTAAVNLREALTTNEGRQQLRAALDIMKEEDRQGRLVKRAPEREERELKWKEKLLKSVPLAADEQWKVGDLFTKVQEGRRQILEEMKSGLKNADQADDEIDDLGDKLEKEVRTLVGEKRMKDLREAEKREKEQQKQEKRAREGQGQAQPQAQTGPPAQPGQAQTPPTQPIATGR